ncbi:hypothetical protein [uncultured Corynebacterium sp.]|uniref:hypothetical protein n=1 Tax=uncultured Corynebacterium sp. TaxID=159447 RepID=UPI0028EC3E17|nr:hypothetical protein [uncultured Corynebacterium sp.]
MSENNNSRQLTILTIAAVVMSVASLITAVAALYTLKYGSERDEARIARLAAVMEENAAKRTTTTAATSTRKTGASTSASATSSRAATSSSASTSRAQASALARTPEPTARAGQAQGTAAQTQPQQATGQTPGAAGQVAAQTRQTTVSTEEQLLDAIGAATDPGASPVDRAEWAADGKTARTTLSEIVRMRNTTGQPSLDVTDIVQTGDHATATITVAFPGNWGSWTFPDSGFQYLDGKWKLQKSAVCSLAQASLTKCY